MQCEKGTKLPWTSTIVSTRPRLSGYRSLSHVSLQLKILTALSKVDSLYLLVTNFFISSSDVKREGAGDWSDLRPNGELDCFEGTGNF